jgi:acyl-CoA dehydrogenase
VKDPNPLLVDLAPDVRDPLLPNLLSGERTMCLGISEPDAGSDIWSMNTTAAPRDGSWVLNGAKQWITNAPYADYAILFAISDRDTFTRRRGGISTFFIETYRAGFSVDHVIRLFGEIGGNEGVITLDGCAVPAGHVIGALHQGFGQLLERVNNGRLYITAHSVGLAKWAIQQGVAYTQQRHTFGVPIKEHQAVQFLIADSTIELYATHSMGVDFAQALGRGEDPQQKATIAKAYAIESAWRTYDRVMQLFGGMGLANETRFYHGLNDLCVIRIADGTSEILRRTIAKGALRGELPA